MFILNNDQEIPFSKCMYFVQIYMVVEQAQSHNYTDITTW